MGNLLNPGEIHSDQKNVEVHFAKKSKKVMKNMTVIDEILRNYKDM